MGVPVRTTMRCNGRKHGFTIITVDCLNEWCLYLGCMLLRPTKEQFKYRRRLSNEN